MSDDPINDVRASYDRVARDYAERLFRELDNKPLDRQLLDRFAERVRDLGPACDLGCGPGQVARYLRDRRVEVVGVDLSPAMLDHACELNPDITFRQGDMRSLDVEAASYGGIAAFYSIIHVPRPELVDTFREMRRVLKPGGLLLLVFHIGDHVVHLEEWWGHPVSVDFAFLRPDEVMDALEAAGFVTEEMIEREPYPDVEYRSRRAYLFART